MGESNPLLKSQSDEKLVTEEESRAHQRKACLTGSAVNVRRHFSHISVEAQTVN